MTTPTIDIAVPSIGSNPDMGIHRSSIKGRRRYRIWWWENGVTKSRLLSHITTDEQAREARDALYAGLVAAGAGKRNKGAKSPQARIRNAKLRGSKRHPYITMRVDVRGVYVGSFATMDEAVAARDNYLQDQIELRKQLRELKRLMA